MCCLLLLVVPDKTDAGENRDDARAYRIGKIFIHRRQVFDGKRADWFGSFLNKFHVLTREDVVRNELLFKEGDIYNAELLAETERNLRALGIIGDVDIVSDTVRNRRVNVAVYTHDRWTLGVKWAYKREGGVQNMAVALNDDNFMGSGQGVSVGYNYRSDRNNPHGAELDFVERRLFGTRFGLRAKYVNSEDAKMQSLTLQRGFYEEAATWAGSIYGDFGQQRFRQFNDGTLVLQDYVQRENQNAWVSFSPGDRKTKFRAGLAYIRARHASSLVPPTFFDRLDLLNVSASVSRREYYKGKFIENFGRVEDVPLGYNVSLIVGRNFHSAGGPVPDMYLRFDGEYSLGWSTRYYLNVYTSLYGFKSGGEFKDATMEQGLIGHWRATERSTLVGKIEFVRGHNWSAGRQLVLGAPTGLPGYGAFVLTGQRQLLMHLQYRVFTPLSLWIFNFGGVLFAASGTAWDAGQPLSRQQLHSTIGFGFRIENSAQQGSGIIRIDFPFNLDRRKFTEVVISSDQVFKAFSDLLYVAPNAIQ
ncbi:MAG: hypothetical protein H6Q30_167 [Bacteroidetes bacterium]|nr:hypothetical protein [Bacteroidota bacterium]